MENLLGFKITKNMDAKTAYLKSVQALNKINSQKRDVKEALEVIKKAINSGRFECNFYNDNNVREALKMMGYEVSEMWKDNKWYQDEMMTISWKK
jgi:hypothetical protein